jgi:hypothetical protein
MQNVASILLELAAIFNAPTPPMAQMESFSFANELPSCVLQRYDWSSHVTMPSAIGKTELEPDSPRGSQVIRFHTANHYYRDNHRAVNFVCTFMPNAISLATDSHILLYASLLALANFPDGVAIELGSGAFKATNLIAAVFAQNTVFRSEEHTSELQSP